MKLSNLVKSLQKGDEKQSKRVGYSCVIELEEEKDCLSLLEWMDHMEVHIKTLSDIQSTLVLQLVLVSLHF